MKPLLLTTSLFLSINAVALAAPVKQVPRKPTPKPTKNNQRIDPRAIEVLERAEKAYRGLRSFSFIASSVETRSGVTDPETIRIKASFQFPLRAAVEIASEDESGDSLTELQLLITDKEYISSKLSERANANPIGGNEDRARWLNDLIRESPALGLGVGALAGPREISSSTNKSVPTAASLIQAGAFQSIGYANVREGSRTLQKVTFVLPPTLKSGPEQQTLEYFFAPQSYWLEKLVIRLSIGKRIFATTTYFSKPTSNWKGSQSATDAAVYNWRAWAPNTPIELPRSKKLVIVEPAAHQLFERAVQAYSKIDRMQLEWSSKESGPRIKGTKSYNSTFAFDRTGQVRLHMPGYYYPLVVSNGKMTWTLDTSNVPLGQPAEYTAYPVEAGSEYDAAMSGLYGGTPLTPFIAEWLSQKNRLDPDEVERWVEDGKLMELRGAVLPSQPLDGKPCELLRITTRVNDSLTNYFGLPIDFIETKQITFWFARGEGRILRVQTRSTGGPKLPEVSDILVTKQDVNPVFDAKTYTFEIPKEAVKKPGT